MILVAATLACVISFLAVVGVRPVLARLGVVDIPNERSSHTTETLRGAGVGPLVGFVVVLLLMAAVAPSTAAMPAPWLMAGVAVLSGVLGLIEDVHGVPIGVRAAIELLIGATCSALLVTATGGSAWWILAGAIMIAGYINVTNFMDGIDGISGLHAIVVGAAYAVVAAIFGLWWLSVAGVLIAAAFAGFLPLNLSRHRVFLGDTGSYLLGVVIAVIALCALLSGVPPLAVLGPVAIYLADTGFTLLRRVLRGERWYVAHRQHVYQRLTDRGLSHVVVAIYVSVYSLVTSLFGLLSIAGGSWAWLALAGIAVAALLYVASPAFIRDRRPRATDSTHAGTDLLPVGWMAEPVAARRWAVVGATGFVGRNLVAALKTAGADVIEVRTPRLELATTSTVSDVLAVLREARIEQVIEELSAQLRGSDVVINAAGVAAPDSRESTELFGANALLPGVIAEAATRISASRYIHLSSAAVQGNARVIDETAYVEPFSPYSRSKALGEQVLAELRTARGALTSVVIVRATSVQGLRRRTTISLRRIAKLPLASVAAPGNQRTPVSSVGGLAAFVEFVGTFEEEVPRIVLQPWEGMTTREVLESAGGHTPIELPASLCRAAVRFGYLAGRLLGGRLSGPVRRIELMWFGQDQRSAWAERTAVDFPRFVRDVLSGASAGVEVEAGSA